MSSTRNNFHKTLSEIYNVRPFKTLKNEEDNLMSGGLTPGILMTTWTDFSSTDLDITVTGLISKYTSWAAAWHNDFRCSAYPAISELLSLRLKVDHTPVRDDQSAACSGCEGIETAQLRCTRLHRTVPFLVEPCKVHTVTKTATQSRR